MRQSTPTLGRIAIVSLVIFGAGWIASSLFQNGRHESGQSSQASYGTPSLNGARVPQSIDENEMSESFQKRFSDYLHEVDPKNVCDISFRNAHDVRSFSGCEIAKNVHTPETAEKVGAGLLRAMGADGTTLESDRDADLSSAPANLVNFPLRQIYNSEGLKAPIVDGGMVLSAQPDGSVIQASSSIKLIESVDPTQKTTAADVRNIIIKNISDKSADVKVEPQMWVFLAKGESTGQLVYRAVATITRPKSVRVDYIISARDGHIVRHTDHGASAN